jgi:hypothetical protein
MQTTSDAGDLAGRSDYPETSAHRADKIRRIRIAWKIPTGQDIASKKTFENPGTFSSLPLEMSEETAITVHEAGKRGGLSCLRNRGRGFFSEIGKTGQRAMRQKYPGMAREWGKRGGRPRKRSLADIMGEAKK